VRKKIPSGLPCFCACLMFAVFAANSHGQATPYARSFTQSKVEIEQALKNLQAYSGQKLPILDGFVAPVGKPLDRYERGFYQFSIELVSGQGGATIVRLSAKITAWFVDRDVSKSGYDVLPSNGRLELDLLDRLQEKLTGRPVDPPATPESSVQTPRPKLDLSGVPGLPMSAPPSTVAKTPDEVATLRAQRVTEERHVQQLTTELGNLKDIERNQAHPQDLVSVTKSGTPVYAKPSEQSRVLFEAAKDDEFEYLDAEKGWIHITISGDSRGYLRQSAVLLPEFVAARMAKEEHGPEEKFTGFRIEREEMSSFPSSWARLKGKTVKIYTVQPTTENQRESGPAVRLEYAIALFEKGLKEAASVTPAPEGVVVIFDAADGGIAGATRANIEKLAAGAMTHGAFWSESYLDPAEAFRPENK